MIPDDEPTDQPPAPGDFFDDDTENKKTVKKNTTTVVTPTDNPQSKENITIVDEEKNKDQRISLQTIHNNTTI